MAETMTAQVFYEKEKMGIEEIPVVVGGVIPKQDIPRLNQLGIDGVFPGGTPFDEIVAGISEVVT